MSGHRVRILLIEDDEEDYMIAREMLRESEIGQHELEWAKSYDAGVEAIRRNDHDIYLVDYKLGPHDGLTLIREAIGSGCRSPIILLTGQGDHDVDLEAMKAGAADYLVKGQLAAPLLERTIRYAVERAQTLQALRRSEERFRFLIEKAHDVVTILDIDSKMLYVSPSVERILGYRPHELIGGSIIYYVDPDDVSPVLDLFSRAGQPGEVASSVEYRFRHKDGSWRFLESVANNLLEDPIVAGVVVTSRDVTNRRLLQEQLIQSEKMAALGQLVAGVAHELNNPLTSIIGYTQLLITDSWTDRHQRERLELISREAERTRRIVSNLLSFARQEKPSRSSVDVNELLKRTLQLRAYEMRVNNIRVQDRLTQVPKVIADENQLQQVFLNVILNAEQAFRGGKLGGLVKVETDVRKQEDQNIVVIKISDDGRGISPQHLSKIFDPFFSTKPTGQSTGMGLSISYGIINEHGGKIWAESAGEEGVTITIELISHVY